MNGDHGARAGGERRADRLGGDAEGLGVDVAEDGRGPRREDRLGGGVEGERGHDHLVPGTDPHGAQGDRDGVGAVGDRDGLGGAAVGGELPLEGLHLGTEDVASGVEHALDRRPQAIPQRGQRRGGVEQGHGHRSSAPSRDLARAQPADGLGDPLLELDPGLPP